MRPWAATTLSAVVLAVAASATERTIVVEHGRALITNSCDVVIPKGAILEDKNGTGVIEIGASNIRIQFAKGSVLRGSSTNTSPDRYIGYGIRLNGHTNVTIRGAKITGYWCGIDRKST